MPYKSLAAQETLDTAAELEIECLDNLQGDVGDVNCEIVK